MKKRISITIDEDIYDWIIKNAKNQNMTTSAFINRVCVVSKINNEATFKPRNVLYSAKQN